MSGELHRFGITIVGNDDPPFLEFAAEDESGAIEQYLACFPGEGGPERSGDEVDLGNGKTAKAVKIPPVE